MDTSQNAAISSYSKSPLAELTSYAIAWSLIGVIALADIYWLSRTGFRVVLGASSRTFVAIMAIVLVACWTDYRAKAICNGNAKWRARLLDLAFTGRWMVALLTFCSATSILSHLSVAVAAPLIDDRLVKIDQAVGFDWLAYYQWVRHHPVLVFVLNTAYASGLVQMIAVPMILGLLGRRTELVHHMARLMIATLICLAIATPFPAASAFLHFHVTDPGTSETVSTFFPIREGLLRTIDLTHPQGLVSLPSMHTTTAILFAYALRRVRFLAGAAIALNSLMVISTPTNGGHYLCDVAAGIMLAVLVIVLINDRRLRGTVADERAVIL